ncbi:MAG: hypothetical protein ACRBG0_27345 [Lewinella sp.]|uniref:hypothetical protein n=1 Tax=Lewinella sp. TaxID=2004506 RepID=UPI003D6B36DE
MVDLKDTIDYKETIKFNEKRYSIKVDQLKPNEHVFMTKILDQLSGVDTRYTNSCKKKVVIDFKITRFEYSEALTIKSKGIKDMYYIIISRGLILRLFTLIETAAIGVKRQNKLKIDRKRSAIGNDILVEDISRFSFEKNQHSTNKERERIDLTFLSVLEFVLYHEMSHIYQGHIEWMANRSEVNSFGFHPLKDKIGNIRLLEHHADENSVWLCMSENYQGNPLLIDMLKGSFSYSDYLSHFVYGLIIFFHFFEDFQEYAFEKRGTSHPHPEIRTNIIYSSIKNIISYLCDIDSDIESLNEDVDLGYNAAIKALEADLVDFRPFYNSFHSINPGDWMLKEVSNYNNSKMYLIKMLESYKILKN